MERTPLSERVEAVGVDPCCFKRTRPKVTRQVKLGGENVKFANRLRVEPRLKALLFDFFFYKTSNVSRLRPTSKKKVVLFFSAVLAERGGAGKEEGTLA